MHSYAHKSCQLAYANKTLIVLQASVRSKMAFVHGKMTWMRTSLIGRDSLAEHQQITLGRLVTFQGKVGSLFLPPQSTLACNLMLFLLLRLGRTYMLLP